MRFAFIQLPTMPRPACGQIVHSTNTTLVVRFDFFHPFFLWAETSRFPDKKISDLRPFQKGWPDQQLPSDEVTHPSAYKRSIPFDLESGIWETSPPHRTLNHSSYHTHGKIPQERENLVPDFKKRIHGHSVSVVWKWATPHMTVSKTRLSYVDVREMTWQCSLYLCLFTSSGIIYRLGLLKAGMLTQKGCL